MRQRTKTIIRRKLRAKIDPTKQSIDFGRSFIILSFSLDARGKLFHLFDDDEKKHENSTNILTILLRCTLVRSVVELWGVGTTIESCAKFTEDWVKNCPAGQKLFERHSQPSQSWKMTVHTLGSTYTRDEQSAMRNQFSYLGFQGPVQMKDPTNEFVLIREVGGPVYPRRDSFKNLIAENDARPPLAAYFGRILGGVRKLKGRGGVFEYSLKKRSYLGPTSMDAELLLIMTNLGQVQNGSFCFDPFVGTGSILVTCGLRGAYCFGSDIDLRVLRGRSSNENVLSNFRQYNLPKPELIRTDNAIYHRHYRLHKPLYDAIICDPPYGIRAGARKTGSKYDEPRPIADEHRHDHIAQTKPYAVSDVMSDLLDVAARTLVVGSRLVYIIPSTLDFEVEEDLPFHECLDLVHVCHQPLSRVYGRRVVTMQKAREYDPLKREEYLSKVWKNGAESAEKCANIRDKLLEAAKQRPDYEEKLAIRKQKRKENREAKKKAKLEINTKADGTLEILDKS